MAQNENLCALFHCRDVEKCIYNDDMCHAHVPRGGHNVPREYSMDSVLHLQDNDKSVTHLHAPRDGQDVLRDFAVQLGRVGQIHFVERHHVRPAAVLRVVHGQLLAHDLIIRRRVRCSTDICRTQVVVLLHCSERKFK